MSGSNLKAHSELATEFNELSSDIHRGFNNDSEDYFRGKSGETLFLMTGRRPMSDEEFSRVIDLVDQMGLPLLAACHAKFGGFIFVLNNPSSSEEPEILFGFEVKQVPFKYRLNLKVRYSGPKNRTLLGAYGKGRNVDELLPYLNTSHSKLWDK